MLELNPDIVCAVIDKAREFQVKEEVVITEEPSSPSDDWALQTLADHVDDLTFAEVKATIDDLEPDQQMELVALMWVGRGDYDVGDWEEALAQARDSHTERTAEYLLATPLVADYLTEGLYQLGYSCEG